MKTALAYKRVSSLEQREERNSIPEQQRRIEEFAKKNEIKIIKQFEDSNSAFHDDNREEFEKMIQFALIERPDYIILDDSSRFARTRNVAIETKKLLRSHGINILYASEPNIDIDTVAGFWLEGIQEIKNEATSREIAFHTKKGMTGNIQQRDIETGWCYKNGGMAPYGYKRIILNRGIDGKGKPIFKTIWELDEITAPIARKIIVDLYTKKEMSYTKIRDFLNDNKIKNTKGGLWATSAITAMLSEDRLEEYTGTAIWNRASKNVIGIKYKPKNEWVICENAHPAIITKEELKEALERKRKTSNSKYKFKSNSDYLLSGLNMENQFLFTCSECNGHIIGFTKDNRHLKKYVCSANNHKGNCACSNNWKIDKSWIEDKIVNIIKENYFIPKKMEDKIEKIYNEISNISNVYMKEIMQIEKEIKNVDKQINNLLNSIKSGVNPELVVEEINNLKEEKDNLKAKKSSVQNNINEKPKINRKDIEEYFYNCKKLFNSSNTNEKRELIKTFIKNITLNKKEHQIEITMYPIGVRNIGAPRGI